MAIFKLIETERHNFFYRPAWISAEEYFRLTNFNLFDRSEREDIRLTEFLYSDPKGTIPQSFNKLLYAKKTRINKKVIK